ncbi:MAG: hypothetical protein ACFFER_12015 [Candidatus Thorarchaeota archaeon]
MTAEADIQLLLDGVPIVKKSTFQKRTEKWVDPETGHFRRRPAEVRADSKNQKNVVDMIYGCPWSYTNNDLGCPWGCYAKFGCKKLKADFTLPVQMILDESVLVPQLRKVAQKIGWIRSGKMGEPCVSWDVQLELASLAKREHVIPVVFTRLWKRPSKSQTKELIDYGTIIHSSICAFDDDDFLKLRERAGEIYLQYGGHWVQRVVTSHFDDTTEEGQSFWNRQDHLMSGDFGATYDRKPLVLQTPTRYMKGEKQRNSYLDHVPDWALFKAPTTRDHRFSAHIRHESTQDVSSVDMAYTQV